MERGTREPRTTATRVPLLPDVSRAAARRYTSGSIVAASASQYGSGVGRSTGRKSALRPSLCRSRVEDRRQASRSATLLGELLLDLGEPRRDLQVTAAELR